MAQITSMTQLWTNETKNKNLKQPILTKLYNAKHPFMDRFSKSVMQLQVLNLENTRYNYTNSKSASLNTIK